MRLGLLKVQIFSSRSRKGQNGFQSSRCSHRFHFPLALDMQLEVEASREIHCEYMHADTKGIHSILYQKKQKQKQNQDSTE